MLLQIILANMEVIRKCLKNINDAYHNNHSVAMKHTLNRTFRVNMLINMSHIALVWMKSKK